MPNMLLLADFYIRFSSLDHVRLRTYIILWN